MESTDTKRTFRLILYDALASEAMGTLTAGVFLTGFLVELGASNLAIGLLAAVPFTVQFLQLPAVVLVERLRARRTIATWAAGIGRSFLIAAATAPFLGATAGIITLVVCVALYQAMAAIAGCAWNSWMRDLVPENDFGRFFGRRATATTALATALALLGGVLIDGWKRAMPGHPAFVYAGLFIVSAVIGFLGVWLLSITPDQPMPPVAQRTRIVTLLTTPFRDRNFRRLIVFLSSWNFAANLAAPFFAVYMLRTLGYSMTIVIVLTTASQLSNLAALGLWGTPHRPFQQQGGTRNFGTALPCLHVGLDLHGPCLGRAGDTLSAVGHPCADGHRHSRRGARFRQHRHETIASRPGNRLPRDQQRGECDLRRDGGGDWRALCRLLRRSSAYARLHLAGRRRCGHGSGAQLPLLDLLLRARVSWSACIPCIASRSCKKPAVQPIRCWCAIYCWKRAGRSKVCRVPPVWFAWSARRH